MAKITVTKYARAQWRIGRDNKGHNTPRIYAYLPAQPRELITCTCGAKRLIAVGQLWVCKDRSHRK